jgi:glycosyltransferase involved in cell wall biosynthesis
MDLRDPWVGNGFWTREFRSALRDAIESRLERHCLRRADCVTVASPGIGNALRGRVPEAAGKLQLVLNGYDGALSPAPQPSRRLRLLYAGSLYFNRDPFPLLEALHALVNTAGIARERVDFTLVGDCRRWNDQDLEAWVRAHGMEDCVHILPPVAPSRVGSLLANAEVLVNFAQGQPDQIPAKLYEYLASGREMLLLAEKHSDAARVTRDSGAGRIVEPQDREGLRTVLRELYTFYVERGLAYAPDGRVIGTYSRTHQNGRFMDLLAVSTARG